MLITTSLSLAAEMGIADLLADGPRSSAELAQATSTHPQALYRLLRLLCSVGVLTSVIELDELTERRARLTDECAHMEAQIDRLRQLEQEQQRQVDLSVTVEEFCRNIGAALDDPSFETKQKILRLVVERVDFVDDQITIRHVIPVSAGPPADVQLRRNRLHNPYDTLRLRGNREFTMNADCAFTIGSTHSIC